jgi:DNA-3-methyladenine glycosylase II
MKPVRRLTKRALDRAVDALVSVDPDLARVIAAFGYPPLWERPPGFPTLVYIVLEQQVSLASARAAFDRLAAVGPITPERFLRLSDAELLAIGFSRQKSSYCRGLAAAVESAQLDLAAINELEDHEARASLIQLKGIGPWTADIYLLMALCRPNIWPTGDLALVQALQEVKGLDHRPAEEEARTIAELWHPWRAAAARILWHWYLSTPRRRRASSHGAPGAARPAASGRALAESHDPGGLECLVKTA